jgi:renalase
MKVAVIGAGVAGAFCSKSLKKMGATVTVFEAGRGPGGRMARRREGAYQFDHGAQFFHGENETFLRLDMQ